MSEEGFWDDPAKSKGLLKERTRIEKTLAEFDEIEKALRDLRELAELITPDDDDFASLVSDAANLTKQIDNLELKSYLSAPEDSAGAIMTIHAGAGGTEAQDWSEMLLRMYRRYCERMDFHSEITDILHGDEAGIKSATLTIDGEYAYGYLRSESGVHRLVRISPFDSYGWLPRRRWRKNTRNAFVPVATGMPS